MRGLCVCLVLMLFTSTVTAKGYGHRGYHMKQHGNIYGHNIIRTQQQYQLGGQMYFRSPIMNQFRSGLMAHPSPVTSTYQSGVVTTGLNTPVVIGGAPTGGVLPQQTFTTIQSVQPAHPRYLGVTHTIASPFHSPGNIPIGTHVVPFQTSGRMPVVPQASFPVGAHSTTFQTTNGVLNARRQNFPAGITNGNPTIQINPIRGVFPGGAQPVIGGVQTTVPGNINNNLGFQDVGFNLPVTSNAGFDSVPQAYVQKQGGLQTGVPNLGSSFSTEEEVGIPKFGGWASPGITDVVVREDNTLPINKQHRSIASILRNFHMK